MRDGSYGNGRYVVIGGAYQHNDCFIQSSVNGIGWGDWSSGIFVNDATPLSVAHGSNRFVVFCNQGEDETCSVLVRGDDAASWTRYSTPFLAETLCFGNGRFVAIGREDWATAEEYSAAISTNGVDWTIQTLGISVANDYISAIAYGDGRFVAVGLDNRRGYSDDGLNWTFL